MSDDKHCAVVPAQMERYSLKTGWFVTAYRIVDMTDNDLIQPWFKSDIEAKQVAEGLGYTVV